MTSPSQKAGEDDADRVEKEELLLPLPMQPADSSLVFPLRTVSVCFPGQLSEPVALFEKSNDDPAVYKALGEGDDHGSVMWPTAWLCAEHLLRLGVAGRSVLEFGCGPGLVSLAAWQAGADCVLATDRSLLTLHLVSASAAKAGRSLAGNFAAELFDVTENLPLPSRDACYSGNSQIGPYAASCASWLPKCFDYVVMADVLHDGTLGPKMFGARVAQALAAGSIVLVVNARYGLREGSDFEQGLRAEAERLGVALPPLKPTEVHVPPHVAEWCVRRSLEPPLLLELGPLCKTTTNPKTQTCPQPSAGSWQEYVYDRLNKCWIRHGESGHGLQGSKTE